MAKEREPLSRSEWQVMRVCWAQGPADSRALHAASLAEASPFQRLVGRWQITAFRTALDRMVAKGYLRTEPAIEVAVTGKGPDKWAVIGYVADSLGVERDRAAAQVQACTGARPCVVLRTLDRGEAKRVSQDLRRLGARVTLREGVTIFVPTVTMEEAVRERSSSFIAETVGDDPRAMSALREALAAHEDRAQGDR